jgi:hypothetical protein
MVRKIDPSPKSCNPSNSFASTFRSKALKPVTIEKLERTEKVGEPCSCLALLFNSLLSSGDTSDVIDGVTMHRTGHTSHFSAIYKVEGHKATATSRDDPRKNKDVRIKDCPSTNPAVRRRSMHVKVPQESYPKRLLK